MLRLVVWPIRRWLVVNTLILPDARVTPKVVAFADGLSVYVRLQSPAIEYCEDTVSLKAVKDYNVFGSPR
jgi:hypothetical protein